MPIVVCLISQEYPPETNWGGIATYTQTLARFLVTQGQKVHVITLTEEEEYIADDNGVTVHRVSRIPQKPHNITPDHGLLSFSQRVYEKILSLHSTDPIDIIEAPDTCAQAFITFKNLNGPVKITRLHTPFFLIRRFNATVDTPEHLIRDHFEKEQARLSDFITSPTRALADIIVSAWNTPPIDIIQNFISLEKVTCTRNRFNELCNNGEYILYFGRLQYLKGIHILSKALIKVLASRPLLNVVFVGNDSVYDSVSSELTVKEILSNYIDRLTFIENIPRESLYPIIENAKFVVMPSLWENFPYACLEAMSLGKVVVASNVGGFPEIIDSGKDGFLCKSNDIEALCDIIVEVLERNDLRQIGANAKLKARQFSTELVATQMLQYYLRRITDKQSSVTDQPKPADLKVCYLLLHIPVPSETFIINEIIALQSLGVDIHTVSLWQPQLCHGELMARINNPIYNLSDDSVKQQAFTSSYYSDACKLATIYVIPPNLAAQAALAAEYVLACAIDHIHAHFATEAALVALLVSKMTGVPYTLTAHAYDIFRLNVSGEHDPDRRLKLLVENSAKTITVSEFNKKHILSVTDQALETKLEVVHCGIDLERFKKSERNPADGVTFLSVGRLVEKKGHELLLRSLRTVVDATCDVRLRIVGEGELRSTLLALADELGIADRVTFVGAVSSDVVLHEMLNADVFVLHSLTGKDGDKEGIPVSIMEACATGLPVVSTRHSGIPELVVEGVSGFLVNERDSDGFAEAMRTLALSPELRTKMGLAGHSYVAEKFNLLHETQKLKDIFAAIIEESSARSATAAHVPDMAGTLPAHRPSGNLLKGMLESLIDRIFRRCPKERQE